MIKLDGNTQSLKLDNFVKIFEVEGLRIRSKCYWYEKGEKSSKIFLTLEKKYMLFKT